MTHTFKLRSTLIFLLFVVLYIGIITNLYIIQIRQHPFYSKLAQQQYNVTLTQRPPRGLIFDRTGNNYLAMNKEYVAAFILPLQLKHPEKTISLLKNHFPHAYNRLQKHNGKHFMFIKRRLSPSEQTLLATEKDHDICLLTEPGRYYPLACAIPLVGLTNIDNKGLMGIELLYDHVLAGNPTTYHLEKDARSGYYYFKKETTIAGDMGKPLRLTIDADIQFLVQEALRTHIEQFNAQEGAVIIMNPINGEIIALVSYPYFDPNRSVATQAYLFKNHSITDAYELGSVIKVCAAVAALEEEVVTPDELIDCRNTKTTIIDGRVINTVKAHGVISFADVIALSNNIGIALIAKRLDKKLYEHYKRLGFGTKTGINFPGENSGFVNPPEKWSKQSIISLSYGYEISATLLQLACAFCTIATGYTIKPILVIDPELPVPHKNQLYSEKTIHTIKTILEHTTRHGTARRAEIKGYRIMTKTGTANMLIDGVYRSDKNIYTCAGIIEKDDYQRVIVTFIKEAEQAHMYAATVAVPLFEKVAEALLIHDKIIS